MYFGLIKNYLTATFYNFKNAKISLHCFK